MPSRLRRRALVLLAGVLTIATVQVATTTLRDGDEAVQTVATAASAPPAVAPAMTRTATRAATPPQASAVARTQPAATAAAARNAVRRKAPPAPERCFGAAAMVRQGCPRAPSGRIVPLGKAAWDDFGPAYDHGCVTLMPWERHAYRRCVYFGDRRTDANIALVGNSHAIHYLPAMLELAARNSWRVTTYFANKCFPTTVPLELAERLRDNCRAWGRWVLADTKAGGFDLVITSNRQGAAPLGVSRAKSHPVWKKGYRHFVEEWLDAGTRVLVIRDNPYPGHTRTVVPDCVARHRKNLRACSAPRSAWLRPDPLAAAARAARSPRARVAVLTPFFCRSTCRPVIGNVLVYRDESHITAVYSRTLAPYLAPHVRRALATR